MLRQLPTELTSLLLLTVLVCGCGPGSDDREITVFAASSLTEAFTEAGAAFEAANPGTHVRFSFAGSSALAVQINEGAPADVFAAADGAQMQLVRENGNAEEPSIFARNFPVVVVPDRSDMLEFAELAEPNLRLVLAAENVPIGRYAREVLAKASGPGGIAPDFAERVLQNLKSEEANVRAVVTKVQLGEADAGIVYQTDVGSGSTTVRAIEIPSQYRVVAEYPIARVRGSDNAAGADAFIAFLFGEEGRLILRSHGFETP